MSAPVAYRCARCCAWATHHFGPPAGHADKGHLHACAEHAPAAEAKWRQIYHNETRAA